MRENGERGKESKAHAHLQVARGGGRREAPEELRGPARWAPVRFSDPAPTMGQSRESQMGSEVPPRQPVHAVGLGSLLQSTWKREKMQTCFRDENQWILGMGWLWEVRDRQLSKMLSRFLYFIANGWWCCLWKWKGMED